MNRCETGFESWSYFGKIWFGDAILGITEMDWALEILSIRISLHEFFTVLGIDYIFYSHLYWEVIIFYYYQIY
jgi:hypothetical protein